MHPFESCAKKLNKKEVSRSHIIALYEEEMEDYQ